MSNTEKILNAIVDDVEKNYEVVPVSNKGAMIIDLLLTEKTGREGFRMTNKEIANKVNEAFADKIKSKTTPPCVAWYVTNLKSEQFRAKHDVSEKRYEIFRGLKADKN